MKKAMRMSDPVPGSFRDPSGLLFTCEGVLYRRINRCYSGHYDRLMQSGLYESLVQERLLVPHEEVRLDDALQHGAHAVIRPARIPFISYPYEWCFSQLKDAALTTLAVHERAIEKGMALKDASAYNIQFLRGKPIFIDTLSFETYREGSPWVAYRQFCQHFLGPLALMAHTDIRMNQLARIYLDGVPLDLASRLLPWVTRLRPSLMLHIHLHARSQARHADRAVRPVSSGRTVSRIGMLGLIDSLKGAVRRLVWRPAGTEWGDYYADTNYSEDALRHKQQIVTDFLGGQSLGTLWDLGANSGLFSRLAAAQGARVIAFDVDPAAVEKNYVESRKSGDGRILPLLMDLTNPSPGIGWHGRERMSLTERGPADGVLALALVHHLAISNNVPFAHLAEFFAEQCHTLLIEFVPKTDSQVKRLLATREDVFPDYTQEHFVQQFSDCFDIEKSERVKDSDRVVYLMKRRQT